MKFSPRHLPWEPGHEIRFPVIDHSHPKPEEMEAWRKMLDWLASQIRAGHKVHAGCIGGHGRTGLLFACLVKEMAGIDDAITYVREHYCKKVVESKSQVDWLFVNWGITKAEPAKKYGTSSKDSSGAAYYNKRTQGGGTSYREDHAIGFNPESDYNLWETT